LYRGEDIHCYGQNVDRLLFNPAAGEAYHAFISGYTRKDGKIVLAAGSAHGVQRGATYGIYASNLKGTENKVLGHLVVQSVVTDTSAILEEGGTFSLPVIFYAVEAHSPYQTVDIFFSDDSPHNTMIKSSPSSKEVGESKKANITLKFDNDVSLLWNGVMNDNERVRETDHATSITISKEADKSHILTVVGKAARFTYHVSRTSPDDSLVSHGLQAQLQEVDAATGQPNGKDLLDGDFVTFQLAKKETRGPFCLILSNHNDFPLWPFIFICDARRFKIRASICIIRL
jgi:hypothetical protein